MMKNPNYNTSPSLCKKDTEGKVIHSHLISPSLYGVRVGLSRERRWKEKLKFIRYSCFLMAILFLITFSSCLSGTPSRGRGWSAPAATEKKVYLTTNEGKLIALSLSARSRGLIFPGEEEWSFPPGDKARLGSLFPSPAVVNGIVYLATLEGRIYALDAERGTEKWKEPYKIPGEIQASPTVAAGKVFVAVTDKIFAIDAQEGRSVWGEPFQAEGRIWAKPAVALEEANQRGTTLFFSTLDKHFYAVDANSGTKKWQFKAGGAILSLSLAYKGRIYFGAFDGNLYALNPASRGKGLPFPAEGEWLFKAGGWIWSGPVENKGILYFATTGGKVYAVDASASGRPAWPRPFEVSSSFRSSPVVYKDSLIVASEEGRIYSLSLADGQMKWASPSSLGASILTDLALSEDTVYIYTQGETLYALDANTGMQRWGFNVVK